MVPNHPIPFLCSLIPSLDPVDEKSMEEGLGCPPSVDAHFFSEQREEDTYENT